MPPLGYSCSPFFGCVAGRLDHVIGKARLLGLDVCKDKPLLN